MSRRRNGETRRMILDYLIREADLDGLATVTQDEIAATVGVDARKARHHLNELIADGSIARAGRSTDLGLHLGTAGRPVNAYQITDAALGESA